MGVCNTMLKTISGRRVSEGDIVVIQSIKYVGIGFGYPILFGYTEEMEREICGKICLVTYINFDDSLRLYDLINDEIIWKWMIGPHMVEPVIKEDIESLSEEQALKLINYL